MNKTINKERGQVLVIVAIAIIGLIGITGLAIDGSMILADRRHAQNAADTAALAGALTYIQNCGNSGCTTETQKADARDAMRVEAKDRADSNGYIGDLIRSQVEVYMCNEVGATCPAPYTGESEYVQVIITSNVDTYFARALGIPQLHNRVEAVALADDDDSGSLFGGHSIVALRPTCKEPGSLILGGSGDITLDGGGIYVNSDGACGFVCNSADLDVTINGGDVTTAGSPLTISEHCNATITAPKNTDGDQFEYPDDLPDLKEPTEWCDSSLHKGSYYNDDVNHVTYITPGYYGSFPPKKEQPLGALYDNIIMKSGIYCVGETVKLSDRNLILENEGRLDPSAGGVTIWIRSGYGFRLEGGEFHLKAQPAGSYANYLFIVEPPPFETYPDGWGTPEACVINGGTSDEFQGGIYAPFCDVQINGSAGSVGFNAQVIGWTVDVTGGAGLSFTYDETQNPVDVKPARTGQTK